MIELILAIDQNFGIGYQGKLPWQCAEELNIFKMKTQNSILIMGRKTVQTLPFLENRIIYCVTSYILKSSLLLASQKNNITLFNTIEEALDKAEKTGKKVFIAGGSQIYNYIMKKHIAKISTVHLSIMNKKYKCDTFIYIDLKNFVVHKKQDFEDFVHYELEPTKYGENQYLLLLKEILKDGNYRVGRNGGVHSSFCKHLKFDLRNGFPLLTTKKMFFRGIVEELLFFLRGDTDSTILENKKVNIWKGNTSLEFIKSRNLSYDKGDMGPMYGYQWRFFNKPYNKVEADKQGVDQLKNVIELIKTDPMSRRILMTSYNPEQAEEGVLYPCHSIILQFYVEGNYIDLFCHNRSQDTVLGTPFNIASTSLLLHIIGKLTNLTPRYFNLTMGDAHIYEEHIKGIQEQLERLPYKFPTIRLPPLATLEDVSKLEASDFVIENYQCYGPVKVPMFA